ncbi:MAG TPA: GNAT family protein [Phycisphaerae bacterium]|nr:GNAT family protein [Phycisphaerae bacterium]
MSENTRNLSLADAPVAHAGQPGEKEMLYLSHFDVNYAPLIAPWVQTERELTWLAPGTAPPLTTEKVIAWGKPGGRRFLFWKAGSPAPIGYAELNNMSERPDQMWIGHFLVDPVHRGHRHGTRLAQTLVAMAFSRLAARDVLLVVFPDNAAAIRCYHRAGMTPMGHERKFFEATGRQHVFLRMGIGATRFRALVAAGQLPADPLPLCSVPQSSR